MHYVKYFVLESGVFHCKQVTIGGGLWGEDGWVVFKDFRGRRADQGSHNWYLASQFSSKS